MGAIDVGSAATDRTTQAGVTFTLVSGDNAANDTGEITTIEVWCTGGADIANGKSGTFSANGNNLTNRDFAAIGAVTRGSMQTFSGLHVDVVIGDYIGIHGTNGNLEADWDTLTGRWSKFGDQFGAGEQSFQWSQNYDLSLHGTGETPSVGIGNKSATMGAKMIGHKMI